MLRFARPMEFSFSAGQYIMVDIPSDGEPSLRQRAFSIASSPYDDSLTFLIKPSTKGGTALWLNHIVREGTDVNLHGPMGRFVLDRETLKEYLFIATGTGIAPLRSHIRTLLLSGDRRKIDLILGLRTEQDITIASDLLHLSKGHPNFSIHATLTCPSLSWIGYRGRVQQTLSHAVENISQRSAYLCGHADMVRDTATLLSEQWNVPKEDIHSEG